MTEREWDPITRPRLIAFAIGLGLFLLLLFRSEGGFVFLLDHANLLFHEAGHPLIGFFSERLVPYGGTLGQLAFPLVLIISFYRQGNSIGLAATGIWFFENSFNIARYMADARALELPLVGGGDHDWNTILSRWGVLAYDTRIATLVTVAGWVGIALVCFWLIWRAWHDTASCKSSTENLFGSLQSW